MPLNNFQNQNKRDPAALAWPGALGIRSDPPCWLSVVEAFSAGVDLLIERQAELPMPLVDSELEARLPF